MFSCEFCKIFKNTYFIEHLRVTASVFCRWYSFCKVPYSNLLSHVNLLLTQVNKTFSKNHDKANPFHNFKYHHFQEWRSHKWEVVRFQLLLRQWIYFHIQVSKSLSWFQKLWKTTDVIFELVFPYMLNFKNLKMMTILQLIHFYFLLSFRYFLQEHFQNYIFFSLFNLTY